MKSNFQTFFTNKRWEIRPHVVPPDVRCIVRMGLLTKIDLKFGVPKINTNVISVLSRNFQK